MRSWSYIKSAVSIRSSALTLSKLIVSVYIDLVSFTVFVLYFNIDLTITAPVLWHADPTVDNITLESYGFRGRALVLGYLQRMRSFIYIKRAVAIGCSALTLSKLILTIYIYLVSNTARVIDFNINPTGSGFTVVNFKCCCIGVMNGGAFLHSSLYGISTEVVTRLGNLQSSSNRC
jgi:hypothetical protein